MSEISLDLPENEPSGEPPMDEPIVEAARSEPEPEPADEPSEPTQAEAADSEVSEEAPQAESRAQKRIRQEIDRRKALEAQLQSNQAQIDQQRQQLQELMQRFAEPEPQAPDFEEDPAAHLLYQQQQLKQQVEQQQQLTAQQQMQAQQAQQMAAVQNQYEALEAQYAQQNPDYYQRIDGLKAQRLQTWEQLGLTRDQAMQRVQEEAWALVQQGLQSGQNPAEVFYSMAPPLPAQPVEEQVAQSAALQQQATSLGSRGTSRSKYTVSDLSSMDASEFDKITSGENWEKLIKSLGG
jgi:DNA repair exonuclease SbcCD ATPase subunit